MATVTTLPLEYDFPGGPVLLHPVLVADEREMVLIDCGYPDSLPLLQRAAAERGLDLPRLTRIIITHHDYDHMGGLAQLMRAYPQATVVTSAADEPYVSGKEKSLRLQQAERLYATLPKSEKAGARAFHHLLASVEPVPVDQCIQDGETLPWCGGIGVIATPGHMPGHLSLYLRESKTLVAGDAVVVEDNRLQIANPRYTLDLPTAQRSIHKLLAYDIATLVCYHGGEVTGDVRDALLAIGMA